MRFQLEMVRRNYFISSVNKILLVDRHWMVWIAGERNNLVIKELAIALSTVLVRAVVFLWGLELRVEITIWLREYSRGKVIFFVLKMTSIDVWYTNWGKLTYLWEESFVFLHSQFLYIFVTSRSMKKLFRVWKYLVYCLISLANIIQNQLLRQLEVLRLFKQLITCNGYIELIKVSYFIQFKEKSLR